MITIVADTHTHTSACDHAYSTIEENVAAAARKGLRFLAVTEHGPAMLGAPTEFYFMNLKEIPQTIGNVVLLKGAEVNIMDRKGSLDLPDEVLKQLDWTIGSMHAVCFEPSGRKEHTEAWIAVANNPHIDVIGHCGDGRYDFDYEAVIPEFARNGKIVEINAHSFNVRPRSGETCPQIAKLCAEHGVRVVVSSDAHHYSRVGEVGASLEMLAGIGFPEELILNADYGRFLAAAEKISGKAFSGLE